MRVTIEDGKDFFRHSYDYLNHYGPKQVQLYGSKENLIARLEDRYKIQIGKNVRQLCGDIILFFPTKTGLTGMGWPNREWYVQYGDFCVDEGLLFIKPGSDTTLIDAAYKRLYSTYGLVPGPFGGYELLPYLMPLYLYHHGQFYIASSADEGNKLHLTKY